MDGRERATPTTVSVRMLWAFARLVGDYERELEIAREGDLDIGKLADPDGRISTLLARKLLIASIDKAKDPALGIHAGERVEPTDFGVMWQALRNCPDVRHTLLCLARYLRLLDDNVEGVLVEEGDTGTWQIRNLIPRPLAALNDFQVTTAITIVARLRGRNDPPLQVHVRHAVATDAKEYERVFRAPVRFNADHNAVVFPRSVLDAPILNANSDFFSVFDDQARRGLEQLTQADGVRAKVQLLLAKRLSDGNVGIVDSARELHMSPSTLRRRLAEEGTTHSDVLEQVRRELALHHVNDRRLAVGEIAFLLGFASQSAFGRAFRRWAGTSPLEYRAQLRAEKS